LNTYIFEENRQELELRRLRRIEVALDPFTIELLKRTGVSSGWECLEVGAGGGSILKWIGGQVGPSGRAVGVDMNTAHLAELKKRPYEIIEAKITACADLGRFDLIHVRYVLIHNTNAVEILTQLQRLLKPGGHLVIEEPDFVSAEWIDEEHREFGDRVNRAICAMFSGMELDPGFGKRLPWITSRLGLYILRVEAITHLEPGGGPVALFMGDSAEALRAKYASTGEATEDEIDGYIQASRNPNSWAVYYSTIGLIATSAAEDA
jgi:2-polyprenyl-3-methyl-5-hydroxy-6-metoxy-1,4-benzoquinol methylase